MNPTAHDSPLGKQAAGSAHYDPGLLFPIARAGKRAELGIGASLPFHGVDIWNAWELSWLDARGKPRVAIGEFRIPAASANLIESKSLKLYLNSFNQHRCETRDDLQAMLVRDLSAAAGSAVEVALTDITAPAINPLTDLEGRCIDGLDIAVDRYGPPDPGLLGLAPDGGETEERLVSHLLKSNCPVTGQPDWASIQVHYAGAKLDDAGLLRYLISFRLHDDFHEQCVERMFSDIQRRCAPRRLTVQARYTRRGGLDINPWRSNFDQGRPANPRLLRE
ncbi:MAG TPA: NADPH-dependent 7-cyano-7-deazaguanine reductase QueF [Dokdonella sp.]|nr:NADPH-dependent 7-cyano-7-deazaguanine reductase QueF [Dokdonella sp.]